MLCLLFLAGSGSAQILKVMSYNLLNYPNVDYNDQREDTLKGIIDYYRPDLFLMQELKSEAGLQRLVDDAFNTEGIQSYTSGQWQAQVSNPDYSWRLQQNVIYDSTKLGLLDQQILLTDHRDINIFHFYYRVQDFTLFPDTIDFYAVVWHLKSSQGSNNAQLRLEMGQVLTDWFAEIDPNSRILVAGDFNTYSSTEPVLEWLTDIQQPISLADPINAPGNWHDNALFAAYHTQSTRTSQINGDGASGGMDDRFDIILLSENLMAADVAMSMHPGSYDNIGNDGGCFNQSLLECDSDVPTSVRNKLYQMSDHLPVKLEFQISPVTAVQRQAPKQLVAGPNPTSNKLKVSLPDSDQSGSAFDLLDAKGRLLRTGKLSGSVLELDLSGFASGIYLLKIAGYAPFKVVVP